MKKRKLKIQGIIIICIVVLVIIISLFLVIKHINYTKTYDYKLNKIGYNEKEINTLKKELKEKQLDKLLEQEYNKQIPKLIKEKYFMFENLNKYLKYIKDNKDKNLSDVIAIINVGADSEFYKNTKETDTEKNELMLVNKYNYLTKDYNPEDLEIFSNQYAYGDNQSLRKIAYDAYISMFNAAKKDGYTLIVNSSYRSYNEQTEIYDNYSSWYGEEKALKVAAKPGYSEHQTGLAVDIQSYCSQKKGFEECEEFTWLSKNAYKYGFILRYPDGLEYLTGYNYESWHYRYVGKEAAKYILDNNITFDEYYAYFVE